MQTAAHMTDTTPTISALLQGNDQLERRVGADLQRGAVLEAERAQPLQDELQVRALRHVLCQ